jgi:uncharacterized protein
MFSLERPPEVARNTTVTVRRERTICVLPVKRSPAERAAVIGICFGYLIVTSTMVVVSGQRSYDFTTARLAFGLAFEVAATVLVATLLHRRGWRMGDFGFHVSGRATLAGVLLYAVSTIAYVLVYCALWAAGLMEDWRTLSMYEAAAPSLLLLFLLVNSCFEEVFVTGYIVEAWQSSSASMAISVSAVVRLLYHTYQGPIALASVLPMGLIFAYAYYRWRNLWVLIVAHTVMNLAYFAQT